MMTIHRMGLDAPERHAQLQQQRDRLQSEFAELKMEFGVQANELKQRSAAFGAATTAIRWAAERQTLMTDLANSRGRSEGLKQTVRPLEARALAVETRLAEVLTRVQPQSSPRRTRHGKGEELMFRPNGDCWTWWQPDAWT